MRTNFVLIDYENVQPDTLLELDQDHFQVIIFVGATQAKLHFDVVNAIQRMGNRAKYIKISGAGPNALDFHIAFYIGQLAAQNQGAFFHIISKDTGFDPLIKHLRTLKILAARSVSVDAIPLLKAGGVKTPSQRADLFAEKLRLPKATRPRTLKTLTSAVSAQFLKQLNEQEIAAIVAALRESGFVSINSAGKVTYPKL